MLDSHQYENLDEFLKDCIRTLKNKFNLKSGHLAQRLDINDATFERIENKKTKRTSFRHAIKIVRAACGEENFNQFVQKFYPEMAKTLKQTYPGNAEVPFVKTEAEKYFCDKTTYEIMMMATTPFGLTKEDIQTEFGRRGVETLEQLLETGVVNSANGRVFLNQNVKFGQETTQLLLQNLVAFSYDLNAFGTNENWLSVQYESVNLKVVNPKIREILVSANEAVRKVLNSPESKGTDVLWVGLVADYLGRKRKFVENNDPSLCTNDEGVIQ